MSPYSQIIRRGSDESEKIPKRGRPAEKPRPPPLGKRAAICIEENMGNHYNKSQSSTTSRRETGVTLPDIRVSSRARILD